MTRCKNIQLTVIPALGRWRIRRGGRCGLGYGADTTARRCLSRALDIRGRHGGKQSLFYGKSMKAIALDEVKVCLIGRCPARVRDGSCLSRCWSPAPRARGVEPLCGRETASLEMDATGLWTIVGRRLLLCEEAGAGFAYPVVESSCAAQGRSRCCGEALLSLSRRTTGSTQRERLRGRSTFGGRRRVAGGAHSGRRRGVTRR